MKKQLAPPAARSARVPNTDDLDIADVLPVEDPAAPILDVLPVAEEPPLVIAPATRLWEPLQRPPASSAQEERRGLWKTVQRVWRGIGSVCEWIFGVLCLIVGLAILAGVPVLQFLSLGYLLEAAGRIARTGKFSQGFIGVRKAARVGGLVLGIVLVLLPLQLVVAQLALSAEIIDPGGPRARSWHLALTVLTVLAAAHIVVACSRGGKLRHFLWPWTNPIWLIRRLWRGGYYAEARDGVWDFVMSLRLPYYFWLGVRGFAGGMLWLVLPVTMLAVGPRAPLVGLLGAISLMVVLTWLPFLQVRFAAENRFRAFFEVGAVRAAFKRAPWAFAFSFVLLLAFALPLYLWKIEVLPRELIWLPGLFFTVFSFPARLLTGWAYARAQRRPKPRHWFFRWSGWLWLPPAVAFYVLIVFFSRYTSWNGIWDMYHQHAFLLPVPFVGL